MSNTKGMTEMWDTRYAEEEYAYGTSPNVFLKSVLDQRKLEGTILFPAEGEGRNAVYAAKIGLNVSAFDISKEGQKKAYRLAEKENVKIDYQVGDFIELELIKKKYHAAALIYAHFPSTLLAKYHQKIAELIEPNGLIILEGFSKGNLPFRLANPKIGGPDREEMLFSIASIKAEFPDFEVILLEETEVELKEGIYHLGIGKVIRFIGKKK
jgi:hypothetical protein